MDDSNSRDESIPESCKTSTDGKSWFSRRLKWFICRLKQAADNTVQGAHHVILFLAAAVITVFAIVLILHIWTIVRATGDSLGVKDAKDTFSTKSALVLSDVLLVIILAELLLAIKSTTKLDATLLTNLLIVGVVAGVRHVLAVGAELTLSPDVGGQLDARRSLMQELGVSVAVVLVLVVACAVVVRFKREFQRLEG